MNATLTLTTEIADVLVDAGTFVLADPTETFGIRRYGTETIVVASGTPVPKIADGVYEYTFEEPAEGVTYEIWTKWTYRSQTYYQQYLYVATLQSDAVSVSPAAVLAAFLQSAGVFSAYDADEAWPVYVSSMPDGAGVPADCAVLYNTAGLFNGKTLRGSVDCRYGVQLRVRSSTDSEGWVKINAAGRALDSVCRTIVLVGEVEYVVYNVSRATPVIPLGRDISSQALRYLHVLNVLVTLR